MDAQFRIKLKDGEYFVQIKTFLFWRTLKRYRLDHQYWDIKKYLTIEEANKWCQYEMKYHKTLMKLKAQRKQDKVKHKKENGIVWKS